ncbi:MAG: cytochrome oxidase subunit IV [Pirellulaceae bacterium]|nr:MAG: cytochrome oxidase subunit IV [Pirellulaceae bacterium]
MSESTNSVADTSSHEEHHGFAHPMPVWQLLAVFFALVGLTLLTVWQATLDLGSAELWVSLLIATIKASLVILFFMHMIHDKPLNAIVFISAFVFVALFIGFTLMDALQNRDVLEFKEVPPANPPVATSPANVP